MYRNISRRRFLSSTVAAASAAAVTSPVLASAGLRTGRMKIGLYTITYLGIWYRGEHMELKDLMRFIKKEILWTESLDYWSVEQKFGVIKCTS